MDISVRRGLPGLAYPRSTQAPRWGSQPTFAGTFNPETVERYVFESYTALLRTATVKAHLAVRVTRFATERLTALAQAKGALAHDRPRGALRLRAERRSLADGGGAHRSPLRRACPCPLRRIDAGIRPNPAVVTADEGDRGRRRRGIPEAAHRRVVQAADVVITMGCGDACPVYPGKRYQDWELDDPEGLPLDDVRRVRDEIRATSRRF